MNGRVYDPLTAIFFSPDPYLQAPGNWLNYNRYGYALNNPFLYTDPDGEFFLMAIFLGAVINTTIQGFSGNLGGMGSFWKAMGIGALSGAARYGAGVLMSSVVAPVGVIGGGLTGAAGGAAGGFVGGAGNAWANGASFGAGLKAGVIGGGWGTLGGAVLGGITGGITAYKHGGNFWTGNGAKFSFDSESVLGVVDADQASISTNEQLNQVLNEREFNLSDYRGLQSVDIEMSEVTTNDYLYYRTNGRLYKVPHEGGFSTPVGGTTIVEMQGFKPISSIYLSTHNTVSNLMKTLNHELIHAYQWGMWGGMNSHEFYSYTESSAATYTHQFYPQVIPPTYYGLRHLYDWPKFVSIY
jgi:hypothetical protein